MVGRQCEVFEDIKSRKILYDKKTNICYLLPNRGEGKVQLLKMNVFNAIAISFIIGYFFNFPIYLYVLLAVALYFVYFMYFNNIFLPNLHKIKKTERKKEVENQEKTPFPYVGLGYLVIGAGLIYCLLSNQVEEGIMTYVVCGAILICLVNSVYYFRNYMKKG